MKTHQKFRGEVFTRMSLRFRRSRYGMIVLVLPSLTFLLVIGCADMHFSVGTKPDISALEEVLKIGQSGEADVLGALGAPSGKGKEMFPIGQDWGTANNYRQKQRTMWSYYYEEGFLKGNLHEDRRILLFVFFDGDRYDGYMWFSSLADAGSQASKIGPDSSTPAETKK